MCIFSTPKIPKVTVPEPAPLPAAEDTLVTQARDLERRRRAQTGQRATLLTSGVINTPVTRYKQLLGQ